MSIRPSAPRKLQRADAVDQFESGAAELDEWVRRFAWENQQANNAVTFVSCLDGRVAGYYAIAMSAVSRELAPQRLARGAPGQVPCILLARLAVDRGSVGSRLGAALFLDALRRALQLSESVGARAVLIHARDESAREFYLHHADCLQSPGDEMQLMIPMKDIARVLGTQG